MVLNMQETKSVFSYTLTKANDGAVPVIIVSAGSSSRMGGLNKQFLQICGVPVIARTLRVFEKSPFISRIILVAREDNIPDMQLIAQKYGIEKITDIVAGGNQRRDSVMCGLEKLTSDEKKVLIHDGARPFADDVLIGNAVAALENNDACVCAVKVIDTIKRADDEKIVTATVDRENLYSVQTPQGVNVPKYLEAISRFPDDTVTDDASLMEKAGYSVKIVDGNRKNIKITTPDDINFAEIIVRGE